MKDSNKAVWSVLAVIVIGIFVYFTWPFLFIIPGVIWDVHHSNRERAQLLYHTDHPALLAACRQVISNRLQFARDLDWHGPMDANESFIDPKDPKIPTAITQLSPRDVIATDKDVKLELHGGFDHYGVIAFSAAGAADAGKNFTGPFQLIPGLWYYDEGLAENHDVWLKKLKRMRPSGVPEPNW